MASDFRVAVVTPYYREAPEVLRRCHDSVLAQSHPCVHFLVGDGLPRDEIKTWSAQHLVLAQPHDDLGNTPRCLASLSAMNLGYDAIAFLDADNWFYPNHIETMIDLQRQTGADVCTATRTLHRLDGSLLYVDRHDSDGVKHVDTNCYFLTRPAFRALPLWAMIPRELSPIGDSVFLQGLRARKLTVAHSPVPTVAYRTAYKVHYLAIGEAPPEGTKSNEESTAPAFRWWRQLPVAARREWSALLMGGSDGVLTLGSPEEVVASAPDENNRGVQLLAQRRHVDAEAAFRRAFGLAPELPEVSFNIGKALEGQARFAEAEDWFLRAVKLRPTWAEAHVHLGFLYYSMNRLTDAEAAYRRALEIEPDHFDALNSLGANLLNNEGRIDEARAAYQKALALQPNHANCHSNLVLNEQYAPGVTLARLAEVHADWERQHAAPLLVGMPRESRRAEGVSPPRDVVPAATDTVSQGTQPLGGLTPPARQSPPQTRDPERPLRLGFVSGDFFYHPVGLFLAPVLERLDREQWFTVCYANQQKKDDLTDRLMKAAGLWRNVHDSSDEALAERIREDKIDMLFDLSGHTGRNRLLTFARRPAPVQLTWMGYVGTTGLRAIDYLIADRFHVPPESEGSFCEKVLRLPHSYLCYEPPAYAPPVEPLPASKAGHVTFGCFNNTAKISTAVVSVWAAILRRIPTARLVLKYHWLDDAGLRSRFTAAFAAEGIAAERLELLGRTAHVEQLKQYNRIDLALDPFPYSGGLTTLEALWMGVPVLTCPGETFASRHSLSYLSNVGLTETITRNLAEYVDRAVSLAGHLATLARLRTGLRERLAQAPTCDRDRFVADLAELLRRVSAG